MSGFCRSNHFINYTWLINLLSSKTYSSYSYVGINKRIVAQYTCLCCMENIVHCIFYFTETLSKTGLQQQMKYKQERLQTG